MKGKNRSIYFSDKEYSDYKDACMVCRVLDIKIGSIIAKCCRDLADGHRDILNRISDIQKRANTKMSAPRLSLTEVDAEEINHADDV